MYCDAPNIPKVGVVDLHTADGAPAQLPSGLMQSVLMVANI